MWIGVGIFLVSLTFFLGFDKTLLSILIYVAIVLFLLMLGGVIYHIAKKKCKKFYEFDTKAIYYIEDYRHKKLIDYDDIIQATYYRTFHLILGNPKGGALVIVYTNKDGKEELIKIPMSRKKQKQLPFKKIIIE